MARAPSEGEVFQGSDAIPTGTGIAVSTNTDPTMPLHQIETMARRILAGSLTSH